MARPGFVLEVDRGTPSLLIPQGAGCRLEKLPVGTRVAYPPESLPGLPDLDASIAAAFDAPLDAEPLAARLATASSVAIVFTSDHRPAPPMAGVDVRTHILEAIVGRIAEAGVADVSLVAANGLRRRPDAEALRHLTGERVFRSFHDQNRLVSHDATDDAGLTEIGTTAEGHTVRVDPRVAGADLVINVVIATEPGHVGWDQLATGVTDTATAWRQISDPTGAERDAVTDVLRDSLEVAQVEVALDQSLYPDRLAFLGKREWEWNMRDRAGLLALRQALNLAPHRVRRTFFEKNPGAYGVIGLVGGAVDTVAEMTRERLLEQQRVEIEGPADVVISGVASTTEHNADCVMNPLVAAWDVLGRSFGSTTGTPVVRPGGVMICFHPLMPAFNSRRHAASEDFFTTTLTETVDTDRIRQEFEPRFLDDAWYTHLYRSQGAFHGIHPLWLWLATRPAVEHCSSIIWVGANRSSAERLGMRAATTLADALEIASDTVGRSPSITYPHTPPTMVADVTGGSR